MSDDVIEEAAGDMVQSSRLSIMESLIQHCDLVLEGSEGIDELKSARAEVSQVRAAAANSDFTALRKWIGVDFVDIHSVDQILQRKGRFNRRGGITSGLVFMPILWTWLCLAEASQAFVAWSSSQKGHSNGATPSFLDLWHQGFGGHLNRFFWFDRFTFGAVAISIFVMVALVVDGTAIQAPPGASPNSIELKRRFRQLELELKLVDLDEDENQLLLFQSILADLGNVVSKIGLLGNHFNEAAIDLRTASSTVQFAIDTLTDSTKNLAASAETIPEALSNIVDTAKASMSELAEMNGRDRSATLVLADLLSQVIPNLKDLDQRVATEFESQLKVIEGGLKQQMSKLDAMRDAELRSREDLASSLPDLLRTLSQLVGKVSR